MFPGNLDPSKALGGEVRSGIQDSGVEVVYLYSSPKGLVERQEFWTAFEPVSRDFSKQKGTFSQLCSSPLYEGSLVFTIL